MTEPQPLIAGFADLINRFPPEHRLHQIAVDVLSAGSECAERRARVLKYPDLVKKLTEFPVGYTRAEQWTGWVPPRTVDPEGREELAASPAGRFNQLGHRARGERENDSLRRAALVEIAAEAWRRERESREAFDDVLAAAGTRREGTP